MDTRTKAPVDVLDYGHDWAAPPSKNGPWLEDGETINSSEWTADQGIDLSDGDFTDTVTIVWVSGGTAGQKYVLTNVVTTTEGRTKQRELTIEVRD